MYVSIAHDFHVSIMLNFKYFLNQFILMVPCIRPAGSDVGDQKRVMTPRQAVEAGATHLVIGRPITGASDPAQAARAIYASLADE